MQKTTFISYSWDNETHKEWVLNLADSLVKYGLDVIFDQYDLSAGQEMTFFMEKAMTADKVIVILTPNYKLKADQREGGVGYEYSLITKNLYDNEPDKKRIIPILKDGNKDLSCPSFIQTRIFHDMSDTLKFDSKFFELTKLIQDKPLVKKPSLGKILNEDDNSILDVEMTILNFKKKEALHQQKKMKLSSIEGSSLFTSATEEIINQVLKTVESYKKNFGINFHCKTNNQNKIIISTVNYTLHFSTDNLYSNSAEYAIVNLDFYKGPYGLNAGIDYDGGIEAIYRQKYKFTLDKNLDPIFVSQNNPNLILTSPEIAVIIVRDVVTNEIKHREERLN